MCFCGERDDPPAGLLEIGLDALVGKASLVLALERRDDIDQIFSRSRIAEQALHYRFPFRLS
jgi:hypothetical protein